MISTTEGGIPEDYSQRIKDARAIRDLTQTQLAKLIGVSYATVNRWENGQTKPNNLSWRRILEIERSASGDGDLGDPSTRSREVSAKHQLDFSGNSDSVWAVAEAHRLAYGHLVNPSFASETSLIDPLPHQLLAVYQNMMKQTPLRFLLADDAGAGKTIMTGLYVREMLARRLIRRVLIVPPAGLVGNWEREMRNLFRMTFRIVSGGDARSENPFVGPESDLVIVSVDTLAGDAMFSRLRAAATEPYDLVVFDEAHKLSADQQSDLSVRKTRRYRLAESLVGANEDSEGWDLSWAARHILLLTATPHMGKDHPYYFLWRLLLPDILPTYEAFDRFPKESRERHFIRRTKEEMVHFDGSPLYPQRRCDTLSYELSQGPDSEQELYNETTDYIRHHYNRARGLNPSAARLVIGVFQRRMASSTYALTRSFERRLEKIDALIERMGHGDLSVMQLTQQQQQLDGLLGNDPFETQTADEQFPIEDIFGQRESQEDFEDRALGAVVGLNLTELQDERDRVNGLLSKAQRLYAQGDESKFEKLREVLRSPDYAGEKFIIFTEHRDTANFLIRRLEGLGFTGQVALIHGGMQHQERERQIEFFRKPVSEQGANFLVATDAAGEGINLQFCWLMVNYDIPWNPARLEQRMGRIHRYGQSHDPVVVINLVAGATREGRVLKTLLDKLEAIRLQLDSDKVFDVIGRVFEGVSIKDYLESTLDDAEADAAVARLDGTLTEDQVRAMQDRERSLFGEGGDVQRELANLKNTVEQQSYRRLLPGYVRRFVEKASPLLNLRVDGDLDGIFRLSPTAPRALDPMLPVLETYGDAAWSRLTVYRESHDQGSIWMHPGEPLFDCMSASVLEEFGNDGLKGAVFVDPYSSEAYLFHIALVTAEQSLEDQPSGLPARNGDNLRLRESKLVGLRQTRDGSVEECAVEHLLLLKKAEDFAPGTEPLAATANNLVADVERFAMQATTDELVQSVREKVLDTMAERLGFLRRGFDYQAAALAAARNRCNERIKSGDARATEDLSSIRGMQRRLIATRDRSLAHVEAEPDSIRPGAVEFLVHALVVPSRNPADSDLYDANVETIAVGVAIAYEEGCDAVVKDVSRPELARHAGLTGWLGFDLLSRRPTCAGAPAQELSIEVKGRSGSGSIELSDNEWAQACNMRDQYWLYVVFDCATPHPRLVRVCDPFGKLLAKSHESVAYSISESALMEAME